MKPVIVVTDSSATVPADQARELGIRVVPIPLALDGRTFRDGIDITPAEVYRWQRAARCLPTTSAPSIGDFVRVYAAAAEQASAIVSIHLSPKLSSLYNVARTAAELVDGASIRVVGCPTVAFGQGFAALEAARAAAAGADPEAVVARAEEVASRMTVLATLDTLEYLYRGGRIGGAAALVGSVLQIKPVVSVVDGYVELFARPRTRSRAIQIILQQVAEKAAGRPLHAAVLHADAPEEAEMVRRLIEQAHRCVELYVAELTPVMGAHSGPGVLGVAFYVD